MISKRKHINLKGKVFGRLKVVRFKGTDLKDRWWLCKCECGKKVSKRTNALLAGRVRSCGCLKRDIKGSHWAGRQFGEVIVIKDTGKSTCDNVNNRTRKRIIYLCKCLRCGKMFELSAKLLTKKTKSCGCLRVESHLKNLRKANENKHIKSLRKKVIYFDIKDVNAKPENWEKQWLQANVRII